MYKHIVVPLDGSPLAEGVLPYVRALPSHLHASVTLICAVDDADPTLSAIPSSKPASTGENATLTNAEASDHGGKISAQKERAQKYVDQVAMTFIGGSVGVEASVVVGHPAQAIVQAAAEKTDALIAMSTHGRTGIGRWLLGSVADKVLHASETPLLLIRGREDSPSEGSAPISEVLVPLLDGSMEGEQALAPATELAKAMGVPVHLIRSVPLTSSYMSDLGGSEGFAGLDTVFEAAAQEAEEYLLAKTAEVRQTGVPEVTGTALQGFPAAQVIDFAAEHKASITVMSTHGRSGVGRWLLGSVTDRVVRHSSEPVLIIRATAT
jgi:nucleotide-binding universal stress UspA family protein